MVSDFYFLFVTVYLQTYLILFVNPFKLLRCVLTGIGAGAGAAIFADIARVTSPAERTGVMSLVIAIRQFGLIAGIYC